MGVRDDAKEATRRRLLDATVSALVEVGYRGTSTLEVQRRANVSRGALLHHFGSRTELVVATFDHVVTERLAALTGAVRTSAPGKNRLEWAIRELWSTYDGPLFYASLELWLAARSDAELLEALAPHDRVMGHAIRAMATEVFGAELAAKEGFDALFNVLTDSMRGAAVRGVLRTEASDKRLLRDWTATAHACLD